MIRLAYPWSTYPRHLLSTMYIRASAIRDCDYAGFYKRKNKAEKVSFWLDLPSPGLSWMAGLNASVRP